MIHFRPACSLWPGEIEYRQITEWARWRKPTKKGSNYETCKVISESERR